MACMNSKWSKQAHKHTRDEL